MITEEKDPKRIIFARRGERKSLEVDNYELSVIRRFAEDMPGGFFIYHADGREEVIYINHAMIRIFGCETEQEFRELTGNTFTGMVHPHDIEAVEKSIAEQVRVNADRMDYVEYRIMKKDGTIRWIEDYGRLISTKEYGDLFYVFAMDGTERQKERMMELEKINRELMSAYTRENQYKQALLADATSFFEVNLIKDAFTSTAMQVLDGQSVDLYEFEGMPHFNRFSEFTKYMSEKVDEQMRDTYLAFFNVSRMAQCYEEGVWQQSLDVWRTDVRGERRLSRYFAFLGHDDMTGDVIALFVVTDLTARADNQDLWQEILGKIWRDGITMNSDITYGITESDEVCDLLDVLADVDRKVSTKVGKKQQHFLIDYRKIDHFSIYARANWLKEIFTQLLDNAIKYTRAHGDISLTVEETPHEDQCSEYRFVVQDNGIGIQKGFCDRIFLPFEREKNTGVSGVFGRGLGLTVIQELVNQMRGRIQIESKEGEGTRVVVTITAAWK